MVFSLKLFISALLVGTAVSTTATAVHSSIDSENSDNGAAAASCGHTSASVVGHLGGDFIVPYEQETFDCLRQTGGWDFVIVRCYRSFGAVDTNAPLMLERAKKAGFPRRDVYHFPCMGKVSAKQQMNDSLSQLVKAGAEFNTMWLDVETNPSAGCDWSNTNFTQNCEFLDALVKEGERLGIKLGVYASIHMWGLYLQGCVVASHLPLWYPRYNKNLNFDDFTPFSGWQKPYIKQYTNGDHTCGVNAEGNWIPTDL